MPKRMICFVYLTENALFINRHKDPTDVLEEKYAYTIFPAKEKPSTNFHDILNVA